jgi:hypothetical protein
VPPSLGEDCEARLRDAINVQCIDGWKSAVPSVSVLGEPSTSVERVRLVVDFLSQFSAFAVAAVFSTL